MKLKSADNINSKLEYKGVYGFALGFMRILTVVFSGILFVSAFVSTCYAEDMTTQQVLTRIDNVFISVAGLAVFAAVLYGVCKWVEKFGKKAVNILLALAGLWCLCIGVCLVLFSKTVPAADAMSVYSIAGSLAENDTSVIHPTESYLSYYPQQVGLVAFFEVLIRLWNLLPIDFPAYHMIKCLYVVLAYISIVIGYKLVHLLWKDDRTDACFILLSVLNLPFIMYTSFVYGEIPSYTAIMAGMYCLVKSITISSINTHGRLKYDIVGIVFFTLSVFLRKNSLIIIIAVVIVSLLHALHDRRMDLAVFALVCAVCSMAILPITKTYYEYRAGSSISSGVTAASYFAMGMQESSRGNGWYNGFNFETYQLSGMNTESANEISRTAIAERATYFKENPAYAIKFYLGKYLSQWVDGTYASRQATLATFGGRTSFWDSVYVGDLSRYYIEYCNIYQNVLYLGVLIFGISECRKNKDIKHRGLYAYTGLAAAFGGFLFHMMWEANSRYIFVYGLLMIPYAAQGTKKILRHE